MNLEKTTCLSRMNNIMVCGEGWHAIKGSLAHRPSSQGWAPGVLPLCVCVCMCVCVCVFGGLSFFCIWVEGLCVVVWRGNGGEGSGSGFFVFIKLS